MPYLSYTSIKATYSLKQEKSLPLSLQILEGVRRRKSVEKGLRYILQDRLLIPLMWKYEELGSLMLVTDSLFLCPKPLI